MFVRTHDNQVLLVTHLFQQYKLLFVTNFLLIIIQEKNRVLL